MHSTPEARDDDAIPWHSGVFYVVVASSLMGVMGVSLLSPVLPTLRSVFGVSDGQVSLVITAYTLPGVFVTPLVGVVADRIGRRLVLAPLLVTFGIAGASIAFVTEFRYVLALRLVQGIGASALITLAVTILGDSYDGTQRDAVIGVNSSATGIGAALFPLFGGALATLRWNVPFLFFGVGVGVGVVALVVLDDEEDAATTGLGTHLGRLREAVGEPRLRGAFLAVFVAFFLFYGTVLTVLPLVLADEFGLTTAEIGPVVAAVALASAVVAAGYDRVANWRPPLELVTLGFVAFGVSLLLVWAAPTPAAVGASLLVFGAGFGVVLPAVDTTVVTLVTDDLRAGTMGVRTSMLRLGQTLGPVVFTSGAQLTTTTGGVGYRTVFLLTGATVTVCGAAAYFLIRL